MKKVFQIIIIAIVIFTISPISSQAAFALKPETNKPISPENQAIIDANNARLAVIKVIDQSKLSKSEKKELHQEVKTIKKKSAAARGGIYISAGALIIIILLLIIIL